MTDSASTDGGLAPALDILDAASLHTLAQKADGKPVVKHAQQESTLSIDTTNLDNGADFSSGSELTPIESLDDEPFAGHSVIHLASSAANDRQDHEGPDDLDDRLHKRRRVSTTPPPLGLEPAKKRKVPFESPPWKKVEAEGPTTIITEDGKRKSGRINRAPTEPPTEPHAAKRPRRGALQDVVQNGTQNKQATPRKSVHLNGNQKMTPSGTQAASSGTASSTAKITTIAGLIPSPGAERSPRRASTRALQISRNRRDAGEMTVAEPPEAADELDGTPQDRAPARSTRIKIRVRSNFIPIVHPCQAHVPAGHTVARPKIGQNFDDFVRKAPGIAVKDGGWQSFEEGPSLTLEQAKTDAQIILRVEEEAEPNGILSADRCTLFVPDHAEEPPRQWVHRDHMVKAAGHFRKLMVIEQQRHKGAAKRLAEACRDEWLRKQPKSAEVIEAECRAQWIGRYKSIVRALAATWENVRIEINRRRMEEWEAAEQKRVKAALNEAVTMSELKLKARRAHLDSDPLSDDEEDDDNDDSAQEPVDDDGDELASGKDEDDSDSSDPEDDDNMSSSEDEEDAKSSLSDADLTLDQIRQKYANVPDLVRDEDVDTKQSTQALGELPGANGGPGSTDESVDMDDDTGSSEEDGSEDDGDDDGLETGQEDEPPSLLDLLFAKSELEQLKQAAGGQDGLEDEVAVTDAPPGTSDDLESGRADGLESEGKRNASAIEPPNRTSTSTEAADTALGRAAANGDSDGVAKHAAFDQAEPSDLAKPSTVTHAAIGTSPPAAGTEVKLATAAASTKDSAAMDGMSGPSDEAGQSPHAMLDIKASGADTEPSAIKTATSRSASLQPPGPVTEVPCLLRGTLREYQHYGLDWLAALYRNKTNGILADEMGLGKTIQTIALLAHLACQHEVWGPHLVIVPTSVMLNWEMEFKKWCPGFKVLSYYGTMEERKKKRQGWKTDDLWSVCITSYQIVLQDQQVFKRRQWHYMILDEAHNIKNFKSKRWQTLLGFNTRARLLLTGTPLQNNLTELWSLLFFLMPSENGVGGFADLAEFQDWFRKPESQILESGREQMDDEARAIIAKLHKVLRPYLLRRLKADVEKQMPAKYEHVEFCRLSRRQRELYDGFLARADTRESLASGNYISVINCLMQLRKVCNHPDLFVERPIMTSLRQSGSVITEYKTTNQLVKRELRVRDPMATVCLSFLNLIPAHHEELCGQACDRACELSAHDALQSLREVQKARAQAAHAYLDPSTTSSTLAYIEGAARWERFEGLLHSVYLNALRKQQRPIYGKSLRDFLTFGITERPRRPKPKVPRNIMAWFEDESLLLNSMVLGIEQRAVSMKTTIGKFACVTPKVVTRDVDQFVLGENGVEAFHEENLRLSEATRYSPFLPREAPLDPWHEARMRLSIQFPDKRLLQYDCGKLQALDRLLRKLQAGGHRALIFTQMTKVLDILELFLNIHGHKYLRLDGATKVEQRQILTDRFNNDPRILAFILSTRSGGLGINLTGADTVIFYDQDWNPAMDKQCQDRCHRIGQTRDVHIYRLVSEHTIEANILRKASQKQMLDDVVIQEGTFTTDYLNKTSVQEAMRGVGDGHGVDVVGDAVDRVLGGAETGGDRAVGCVLAQAEDREDVDAARVAEREIQEDEAEFEEKAPTTSASGTSSARQGTPTTDEKRARPLQPADESREEVNAWGGQVKTIDEYMLGTMAMALDGTPLDIPRDKKKGKSKKDVRKR